MSPGPLWFVGIDAIFDLIFALVTAIIALLGVRAWRFFRDPKYLAHASGFGMLSLGYLLTGAANMLFSIQAGKITVLHEAIELVLMVKVLQWLYTLFFIGGIVILAFVYLQIRDRAVQILLALLVILSVALSTAKSHLFHIVLAIILLAIIIRMLATYKKRSPVLPVLFGFIFVFIGEVLLGALLLSPLLYVIAHVVTLLGYGCFVWGLWRR